MASKTTKFKSGFIALIGRPNVGKSTLINALVKDKVAIVSDKPQTTRNKVSAIFNTKDAQLVFIDTPGIHKPGYALGEYMVNSSLSAIDEVDLVLFIVDATIPGHTADAKVAEYFKKTTTPIWAVINKCDVATKEDIEKEKKVLLGLHSFAKVICTSAVTEEGLNELVMSIMDILEEGPKYYPDDVRVDHPESFIVSEFIREKLIIATREEIPYSVAVTVESMKKRPDRDLVDIEAYIIVEKESQKGIVIGAKGQMLKLVNSQARADIEKLLGSQVNLQVWVKVKKDWRDDISMLNRLGYE